MMSRQIKGFGWVPDIPDARDVMYSAPMMSSGGLPAAVDLRPNCPPVYNQGELGSCTSQAIAGAIQYEQLKQGIPNFIPSRLFIYYNTRLAMGTVNEDSGGMLRDGIKSVAREGSPPEDLWPYDVQKFNLKPSDEAYTEALKHQVVRYYRIPRDLNQMKSCLASGYPFVFGFTVYSSLGDHSGGGAAGTIPIPKTDEEIWGGHAVTAVGYDDATACFIFRNSWGVTWGDSGYGYIPYVYLQQRNMSSDFWTVRFVEDGS
jgi:C1A family cysteine protease